MTIDKNKLLIILANKCISIRELAKSSGLAEGTISRIKAGKSCSLRTLGKISKALEVPVEELILEY